MAPKDLLSEVYALPYEAAYERLKAVVPRLTKAGVLDLLPRIPYIPECLPPGSTGEKVHAAAAEQVLARALELLGLNVLEPRRQSDQPDVMAQGAAGISVTFEAKCFRQSRSTLNVKDFKVHKLDEWRAQYSDATFGKGLQFVSQLESEEPEELGDTGYEEEEDDYEEEDDEEEDEEAEEYSKPLVGTLNRKWEVRGAVLVVPYLRLLATKSRVNEECCDLDVTLLSWEHVYALLRAGADDRRSSLDAVWHMTRTLRARRRSSRWKDSLFAEEDELLAGILPPMRGQAVPPGMVRDWIGEALLAERSMLLAEQTAVQAEEAAVAKMDVAALRAEVLRLRRVVERRVALEASLGPFDEWLEGRNAEE